MFTFGGVLQRRGHPLGAGRALEPSGYSLDLSVVALGVSLGECGRLRGLCRVAGVGRSPVRVADGRLSAAVIVGLSLGETLRVAPGLVR